MSPINSYFIDQPRAIDTSKLRSRCLRKHFNLGPNNMVGCINHHTKTPTLTIFFEKKCSHDALYLYSKLFLLSIHHCFSDHITVHGLQLQLGALAISTNTHYHTQQSGVFCHAIVLGNNHQSVAHLDVSPKDFCVTVFHEFKHHMHGIAPL